MRIIVNQLPALGARTGIGHYTVQLLRCLRAQAGNDTIDSFPEGWLRGAREAFVRLRPQLEGQEKREIRTSSFELRASAEARSSKFEGPQIPSLSPGWRSRALSQVRRLGRKVTAESFRLLCNRRRFDLYHEPNFIPLPCDRPTIVTLHDMSVLLHPEWHPADRVAHFEKYFARGLNRCQHFLAISEFGRQEIINTLHIKPDRVTTTYMGVRPGLSPLPQQQVQATLRTLGLPSQYLLYVGTIEPRKNVLFLLKTYASLPAELRCSWPLLLVGSWGWNAGPVADYLHGEGKHRGILHRGYIEEKHLAAVYNGARVLVYPSLYEGFGLPPVEMMACGGGVIASTAGALVETVGQGAHLLDPQDMDAWRQALLHVLTDDDWWRDLRNRATTISGRYTWERCAADTLQVYHQVVQKELAIPSSTKVVLPRAG